MEKTWLCPNCDETTETFVVEKEQTLAVKGVPITLTAKVRVCKHCNEEIIDETLDDETLRRFYDEYKKSENLLTSEDIRNIRMKYGLSQVSFSKLLGFGEKTITRYENGAIQDVCHDNLMRLMKDMYAFEKIWALRKNVLTTTEIKKVEQRIRGQKLSIETTYSSTSPYSTKGTFCVYMNEGDNRYVG